MDEKNQDIKRKVLRESVEDYKREALLKGKIGKCVNKLYSALRYLDSSLENCEDQELRKKLEKIKNVLGQDMSLGYEFEETEPMTIINKLENIRRKDIDV